jgi:hypothetical protein
VTTPLPNLPNLIAEKSDASKKGTGTFSLPEFTRNNWIFVLIHSKTSS